MPLFVRICFVVMLFNGQATLAGPTRSSPQWSLKMQALYQTLAEIMTDVSSDQRFENPKNRTRLLANTKKLSELAHDLNRKGTPSPDQDPSVIILGNLFSDETQRAYHSLKMGDPGYARELLRSVSNHCMACHTRSNQGVNFKSLPLNPTVKDLSGSEKGQFYAATRQYDLALEQFDNVIKDSKIEKTAPFAWANAVRDALAVAVRAKKDPDMASKLVGHVISAEASPYFMKQDAEAWRQSINEWKKEPKQEAQTEEALYLEAKRLMDKAKDAQKFPADHSADIYYLRASAAIHDLLQLGPKSKYAQEAYLMAGRCYDVLRPFHLGELHEIYFETCIYQGPHTPLAQTCFHQFQRAVFEGYTGSKGTKLPDDEKAKLKKLEDLARPPTTTPQQ